MSDVRDSEGSGTGRLLGLFFGLVVLCAVFFAFGFTLGRSTVHAEPATTASTTEPGLAPSGEPKPEAGIVADNSDCPSGENCASSQKEETPSRDELTFYRAVSQKQPEAKLLPPDPPPSQTPVPAEAHAGSGPRRRRRRLYRTGCRGQQARGRGSLGRRSPQEKVSGVHQHQPANRQTGSRAGRTVSHPEGGGNYPYAPAQRWLQPDREEIGPCRISHYRSPLNLCSRNGSP